MATATKTVTVTDAAAASVAITPASPTVTAGGTIELTATVTSSATNETYDYAWTVGTTTGSATLVNQSGNTTGTSSKTNPVRFTAGANSGTVVVTVSVTRKVNGSQVGTVLTDSKTVTVGNNTTPSNFSIYGLNSAGYLPLDAGGTLTYVSANVTGLTNPTDYYIRWSTSDSNAVPVRSANGSDGQYVDTWLGTTGSTTTNAYMRARGYNASATITATLYNRNGTAVTGYTRQFTASVGSTTGYSLSLSCSPASGSSYAVGYYGNGSYNDPYYWNDPYYNNYYGYRDFTVTPSVSYNGTTIYSGGTVYNNNAGNVARVQVSFNWYLGNTLLYTSGSTNRINSYYSVSTNGNNSTNSSTARIYASDVYNYTSTSSRNLSCSATAILYNSVGDELARISTPTTSYWTVYSQYTTPSRFTVSATVNQGETYYLNSTNSGTSTSVIDQINNYIRNNYHNGSYYGRNLRSITFSSPSHTYGSLSSSSGSYTSSNNFNNLYFTPTTSAIGSSATASFSFTAYDDYNSTPYYGTLNITVKPGSTSASGFSLTGNQGENLVLSASDFSSWWRGLYSNGTLSYVQFTSVSGGNLYANYSVGGRSNVVSSTNATRCYVNPSSSQTGISSLTFVPSSSTTSSATLSFTAYGTTSSSSSSTVARTSTVSITLRTATVQNVSVRYSSTGGSVPFSYSDFYYSHTSVQTSSYITFGTPSNGSLTAGGSAVSTSTRFSFTGSNSNGYQSISTVTYTPASGYNGTATVPFYAYNTNGGVVANGTVYITVTQPAQPVTPSISFSDVPKNSNTSWYYDCVARLVSNKIVGGYPDGTFKPNGSVTNAEALKLIMLAAGYPSQPNAEANGVPGMWAANYLNAAINAGIVSSSEMKTSDLNKAINRNTIASITAKALKLTPVTDGSNSPFADSKDQWVLALNKAGIIQGTTEASGTTYFYGTQSLTRAQLCLIIERVMNYKQTGSAATPSTPNTPSTPSNGGNNSSSSSNEKPGWLNT